MVLLSYWWVLGHEPFWGLSGRVAGKGKAKKQGKRKGESGGVGQDQQLNHNQGSYFHGSGGTLWARHCAKSPWAVAEGGS